MWKGEKEVGGWRVYEGREKDCGCGFSLNRVVARAWDLFDALQDEYVLEFWASKMMACSS